MFKCLVCGMIINGKNYLINNNAIPEKNHIDNVKYCPFCGAPYEYFGDVDDRVIEVNTESLKDSTIKILDHAMKLEVFNSDFYKESACLVEDEDISKMFLDLSRVELVHAKIHQKMGGFQELPVLTELDYTKYKGKDGDNDLLGLAKKREIHAVEYYKKYFNNVEEEGIKKIFEALWGVEQDHVNMEEHAL